MSEKQIIEINVQLEFKDFWQVLFWKTLKRFWLMYFLTLAISLPMLVVCFYALFGNSSNVKFSPAFIFPLLPLLAVLLIQWSIYSSAKKSSISEKREARWIFYENDFDVFTPVSKSENDWKSLTKVEENSKTFLLFLQENIFMIIPKRFFESETQIQKFRELIRKKLDNKTKLK